MYINIKLYFKIYILNVFVFHTFALSSFSSRSRSTLGSLLKLFLNYCVSLNSKIFLFTCFF